MTMIQAEPPATQTIDEAASLTVAACLFQGLSDPTRLTIMRHLSLGEHRVVELTQQLGMAQSTVSAHLACLKDCGLVSSRPEGRASMWSLNHTDLVLDLLAGAERLLAATGEAVALCATYGVTALPATLPVSNPATTTDA